MSPFNFIFIILIERKKKLILSKRYFFYVISHLLTSSINKYINHYKFDKIVYPLLCRLLSISYKFIDYQLTCQLSVIFTKLSQIHKTINILSVRRVGSMFLFINKKLNFKF